MDESGNESMSMSVYSQANADSPRQNWPLCFRLDAMINPRKSISYDTITALKIYADRQTVLLQVALPGCGTDDQDCRSVLAWALGCDALHLSSHFGAAQIRFVFHSTSSRSVTDKACQGKGILTQPARENLACGRGNSNSMSSWKDCFIVWHQNCDWISARKCYKTVCEHIPIYSHFPMIKVILDTYVCVYI